MAIASLLSGAAVGAVRGDGGPLEEESAEWVEASIALAFQTGAFMFVLGLLGAGGWITRGLSGSMLSGFTTGVACIIFLSQLPKLLGLTLDRKPYSHMTIIDIVTHLGDINVFALILGLITAAFLVVLKKWRQQYHKPDGDMSTSQSLVNQCFKASKFSLLFAGIATTIFSWGFHNYSSHSIPIVGSVPKGLPTPSLPSFSSDIHMQLVPGAAMISVITFAGMSD